MPLGIDFVADKGTEGTFFDKNTFIIKMFKMNFKTLGTPPLGHLKMDIHSLFISPIFNLVVNDSYKDSPEGFYSFSLIGPLKFSNRFC